MSATGRWADQLGAWAIPQYLLDAVDESPYGWPQSLWSRRSDMARENQRPSLTTAIVGRLAGVDGSIIDIGAGRGRASLPLAVDGHELVAVERDSAMAAGLREDAEALGARVEVLEEPWPAAADHVSAASVVMSAHVVYDVADIGPFIAAMHAKATAGVVIELTPTHPWSGLAPYYRELHGIDRPEGPTAGDLVDVVEEVVGLRPAMEWWERDGQLWFADWDEVVEYYCRRLVLPRDRRDELRPMLEPDVTEIDGRLFIGDQSRRLATIWWETG